MSKSNEINTGKLLSEYPYLKPYLAEESSTLRQALLQEVDESVFSLIDWVESLVVLHRWLDANDLTLLSEYSLGYISCAAKSVGSDAALTHLPSLVHDFLEQYGCERAVRK